MSLRLLSEILRLPVVSSQTGKPLGMVNDFVLDAAKGVIEAYEVRSGRHKRYLSTVDISKYYDNAVLVPSPDVLQRTDELIRLKELLNSPIRIIGSKVVTEEGKKLGTVRDCMIHSTGHFIAKINVKPNLLARVVSEERIISRENILKVMPRKVVVRYDMKAQAANVEPEIAQ